MPQDKARPKVFVDNDRVRVTEWRFAPGAAIGHHRHEFDYVVVPLSTGKLLIRDSKGERHNDLLTGKPYFREAGVEHEVTNATDGEFAFIEIEVK
ncbi:MAG: cupin domain-containing protein [Dehalococcoidia bacterium]